MTPHKAFKGPNSGPPLLPEAHRDHPYDLRSSGEPHRSISASESRRGGLTNGQQLLVGIDAVIILRS